MKGWGNSRYASGETSDIVVELLGIGMPGAASEHSLAGEDARCHHGSGAALDKAAACTPSNDIA
jgi:hypothetical protein